MAVVVGCYRVLSHRAGVRLARADPVAPHYTEALGYIPPAAFAALVANDLVNPGAFDAGLWPALVPWIAAAGVVAVAIKTKSMLWCCVSGIVFYIVLSLV